MNFDWAKEFPAAVTVSDAAGIIIYMNDRAVETFSKYGGCSLIGKSLIDVHPEPSRTKVKEMMKSREVNSYTIEKNGVKKLIYQAPWFDGGEFKGYVELSMEIPLDMPHHIRG
jgi:PAS domain S-box-containing protein